MHVDYLIIGQGICGSFLSYYLSKEGASFLVIDNNYHNSSSKIAGGTINPVTGRRMSTVWMADQLLPFAWSAYNQLGAELNITAISRRNVIDFFPNPFMRENFLKRVAEGNDYVKICNEHEIFAQYFNFEFGCGEIDPVYTAHLESILPAWRRRLVESNSLMEDEFDLEQADFHNDGVRYKDITASMIIFCDGPQGMNNRFFNRLPFAPNKGEALVLEIPELPDTYTYKKTMLLTPMHGRDKHLFWIGSSYVWDFDNADPTEEFRERTSILLKEWLRTPFSIVEHRSGLRPATLERRPFVGIHPLHKRIGILNGMGTKGCSLAPFFAKQLTDHLIRGTEISADANVNRFAKVLSR